MEAIVHPSAEKWMNGGLVLVVGRERDERGRLNPPQAAERKERARAKNILLLAPEMQGDSNLRCTTMQNSWIEKVGINAVAVPSGFSYKDFSSCSMPRGSSGSARRN
jgi:hypothetical protein